MKKFAVSAALMAAIGCSLGQSANAGEVIGLTVFSPEQPALAAEVNGNFNSLKAAIESSNTRIGDLETATSGLGAVKATVDANNTRLGTVETLTNGNSAAIAGLRTAVDAKMDTVTANSKIDAVQQSVDSKASASDLATLKAEVAALKSEISGKFGMAANYAEVQITNTKINGGSIIAPVAPGSAISVTLDYAIRDTVCPGCIDQIQVGFTNAATATGCVYNGQPGPAGVTGSGKITLTAPQQPGFYFIGFDRSQQFSCLLAWSAPKTFNRYIAMIVVQ